MVNDVGSVDSLHLRGEFAKGKYASIVDVLFIGDDINKKYVVELKNKT